MPVGKDAAEVRIAKNGAIHVAEVGTTLPDGSDVEDIDGSLDSGFVNLGYATEDGVTFSVTPEILEVSAWQARTPVRRDLQAQALRNSFGLIQWNAHTVQYAFGGGAITEPTPGVYRYDFPDEGDALDERSLIVDWEDGDSHYRLVVPRGNVTEAVETNLVRSAATSLPITHDALEPEDGGLAYILSDDPAFGTGS